MSSSDRILSVRVDEVVLQKLQALAVVDDSAIARQIRAAIDSYIESRISEPLFVEQLESAKQRHDAILDVLQRPGSELAESG